VWGVVGWWVEDMCVCVCVCVCVAFLGSVALSIAWSSLNCMHTVLVEVSCWTRC